MRGREFDSSADSDQQRPNILNFALRCAAAVVVSPSCTCRRGRLRWRRGRWSSSETPRALRTGQRGSVIVGRGRLAVARHAHRRLPAPVETVCPPKTSCVINLRHDEYRATCIATWQFGTECQQILAAKGVLQRACRERNVIRESEKPWIGNHWMKRSRRMV